MTQQTLSRLAVIIAKQKVLKAKNEQVQQKSLEKYLPPCTFLLENCLTNLLTKVTIIETKKYRALVSCWKMSKVALESFLCH